MNERMKLTYCHLSVRHEKFIATQKNKIFKKHGNSKET